MFDFAFALETEMNKTSTPQVVEVEPLSFRHTEPQVLQQPDVPWWDGFHADRLVDNRQYRQWQGWMSNKMDNTSSYNELVELMKDIRPCVNRRLVFENC